MRKAQIEYDWGILYIPPSPTGMSIVYCHGGWRAGNIDHPDVKDYLDQGFSVGMIKYDRKANLSDDVAKVLAALKKVKEAWTDELTSLVGISRGGYLVYRTMISSRSKVADKVVVGSAPFDLLNWPQLKTFPKAWRDYFKKNPLEQIIDQGWVPEMPVLIVHGQVDAIVPYQQAKTANLFIRGSKSISIVNGNHSCPSIPVIRKKIGEWIRKEI